MLLVLVLVRVVVGVLQFLCVGGWVLLGLPKGELLCLRRGVLLRVHERVLLLPSPSPTRTPPSPVHVPSSSPRPLLHMPWVHLPLRCLPLLHVAWSHLPVVHLPLLHHPLLQQPLLRLPLLRLPVRYLPCP